MIANQTGYVLVIGPDGTRQAAAWFTSDRDTQVQALASSPAGELALAGIRNGPITHTDSSQLFRIDCVSSSASRITRSWTRRC